MGGSYTQCAALLAPGTWWVIWALELPCPWALSPGSPWLPRSSCDWLWDAGGGEGGGDEPALETGPVQGRQGNVRGGRA